MDPVLWSVQVVIALTFFAAGSEKLLARKRTTGGRSRIGAVALEVRRHEIGHVAIPAIFFILSLFVGWGRLLL